MALLVSWLRLVARLVACLRQGLVALLLAP